ncbi:unnamed protein product [Pieris macdunnoughi]|uniref:Uncharacterized protein n=1 Tax=Pieris macdunnoughi TaxID=345717 RepID=A0A821LHZ3_9NEOP|nr:unnamed protein product [Pieris macdunnoughi]
MSIFFFRLHNLRRDEGKMRRYRRNLSADNLTAPSRLLERPLSQPTDSLDEIAFQIPRCASQPTLLDTALFVIPKFYAAVSSALSIAQAFFEIPQIAPES